MLRRYGVMSRPGHGAARPRLRGRRSAPDSCCRTAPRRDSRGRLRGWRDGAGLERRDAGDVPLLDLSAREALALRRRAAGLNRF